MSQKNGQGVLVTMDAKQREIPISQNIETDLLVEGLETLLRSFLPRKQAQIAVQIILELRNRGCYARSGSQLFITELKLNAPRATVYRVVRELEKIGLVDRQSRFSGYFLSHVFSNRLEEQANWWRRFCKG